MQFHSYDTVFFMAFVNSPPNLLAEPSEVKETLVRLNVFLITILKNLLLLNSGHPRLSFYK